MFEHKARPIYLIIFILAVLAGIYFVLRNNKDTFLDSLVSVFNQNIFPARDALTEKNSAHNQAQKISDKNQNREFYFHPPISRSGERVTKKPFGIYITPRNSPVQPEKFSGYHTGADFEIFPEELSSEVPVRAVCSGKLSRKEYATGYGGVAVQTCVLDNKPITVIYGHLKLANITTAVGSNLNAGDPVGILGAAYSQETSGERKHLHLGFHKGTDINIVGYAGNEADLSSWIDPCLYVCQD